MAWYYQTTPEDHWDYDATQKLILTTLRMGGVDRDVIMQASKNGFFYVLDRKTGELLSAKNYTYVNWTQGVDPKTGRPAASPASDWYVRPRILYPSWAGGHTWNPMAYSPKTGLVYLPAIDAGSVWVDMAHNGGPVTFSNGAFTANTIIADSSYDAGELSALFGPMPELAKLGPSGQPAETREVLRAWDPVKQRSVWEHTTSAGFRGYDGGVMTTASNLVFQGLGSGELVVYAADSGRRLTAVRTGSHIMAAPMTYAVNGQQYVAVQVGYGGTGVGVPFPPSSAAARFQNINRIIALKLGNRPVPTPPPRVDEPFPAPPPATSAAAVVARGKVKFFEDCAGCHAFGANITVDLRKLPAGIHAAFKDIVLKGVLASQGMERFDDLLTGEDVDAIHAYLIEESWKAYSGAGSPVKGPVP
jgi:quinohemoprotein ethanol dehydrogenase